MLAAPMTLSRASAEKAAHRQRPLRRHEFCAMKSTRGGHSHSWQQQDSVEPNRSTVVWPGVGPGMCIAHLVDGGSRSAVAVQTSVWALRSGTRSWASSGLCARLSSCPLGGHVCCVWFSGTRGAIRSDLAWRSRRGRASCSGAWVSQSGWRCACVPQVSGRSHVQCAGLMLIVFFELCHADPGNPASDLMQSLPKRSFVAVRVAACLCV